MERRFVLPDYTVSHLKCDLCHGYLSVPPIYSYKERYACGRCNPEWERNVIYEQLAQYMVFPCTYCNTGLAWEMVRLHEEICKQNRLLCPPKRKHIYRGYADNIDQSNYSRGGEYHKECHARKIRCPFHLCLINYEISNILQHFNKFHREYIFTNTVEAKKILKEEKIWNFNTDTQVCLLVLNTIPFLLFVHSDCDFDGTTGNITVYNYYFSLFTLCLEKCDMKYTITVQITPNSNIPIVRTEKNQEIIMYNDKIHRVSFLSRDFFKLNSFNFMTTKFTRIERTGMLMLNYTVKIVDSSCQILPEKSDNQSEICHLLGIERNFECPICKEYMSPPIYNCNTGHTICRHCREKLTVCPYCKAGVKNSRNYVLEDILETLLLNCHNEYKGCKYTGKVQEIKLHELVCEFN